VCILFHSKKKKKKKKKKTHTAPLHHCMMHTIFIDRKR